jgi:hypothetical protein
MTTAKPKVLFVAQQDRETSVNFYQIVLGRASDHSINFSDSCEALVSQNSEDSYYR